MIDKVLDQSGKLLSSRTILTGGLPMAGLLGVLSLMVMAGLPARPPSFTRAAGAFSELSTAALGAFVAAAIVGGMFMEPLNLPITRAFEGYWGKRLVVDWFRIRRINAYQARQAVLIGVANAPAGAGDEIQASAAAWELYHYFPSENTVLPTRLGNVLRSAEQRPQKRYGLDAIVFWPRLYPLLSDRLAAVVDDARDQMDFAVRVAALSLCTSVASLLLLLPQSGYFVASVGAGRWWPLLWLLVPAGAGVLAWLAYKGAIYAALQYGMAIQTAYDLHRFDLLKALHLELPTDTVEEHARNREISMFYGQDATSGISYHHPGGGGAPPEPVTVLKDCVIF